MYLPDNRFLKGCGGRIYVSVIFVKTAECLEQPMQTLGKRFERLVSKEVLSVWHTIDYFVLANSIALLQVNFSIRFAQEGFVSIYLWQSL